MLSSSWAVWMDRLQGLKWIISVCSRTDWTGDALLTLVRLSSKASKGGLEIGPDEKQETQRTMTLVQESEISCKQRWLKEGLEMT